MRPCRCMCITLALLPLFLFGCGGDDSMPASPKVSITPANVTLPVGGSQDFTANVTGLSSAAITWSVQEANGGSITPNGAYTAPNVPGTFHVIATSQADATQNAAVAVTVQAGNVQGTIH